MLHRSMLRAATLLLAALALAQCAPSSEAQPRTIRFGATISITGPTAKEGEHARDGYLLAIEAINARGGIRVGGRSYLAELRYYDDESRPERATELYEKLIAVDRVDFLLGPYGSGPTAAAAAVAERHRIPLVEGNGSADSIFAQGYRYTFGIMTPASGYLRGMVDLALAADPPLRTLAILHADDIFSRATAEGAAAYAQQRGMRVVAQAQYPADSQDVAAQLAAAQAARPDLLLGATHLQDALLIVRQAQALGFAPRAMGFSVGPASPTFRKTLGGGADYVLGSAQWTPALAYQGDDPWGSAARFDAAFRQRFPDSASTPYTAACSAASLVAYQRAIELAGTLDPAMVRDQLQQLAIDTFFGPIRFDAAGLNRSRTMAVEQLLPDGSAATVYPLEMADHAAIFPAP